MKNTQKWVEIKAENGNEEAESGSKLKKQLYLLST